MLIKTNQPLNQANTGHHQDVRSPGTWLSNLNLEFDWRNLPKETDIKQLVQNFDSPHTHAGLAYYLYYCWANEKGCTLRPDMIWYTVVSEVASQILANPEEYRHLFTDSTEKKTVIQLVDRYYDIDVGTLIQQLETLIQSKDFFDTITNTRFKSDTPNTHFAMCTAFACMATPYFDYMTTMCGIPVIDLQGDQEDWINLSNSIFRLFSLLPNNKLQTYLKNVQNVVGNILYHSFQITPPELQLLCDDATEFYSNIFNYYQNPECMSGHSPNLVKGWIKQLYFKTFETPEQESDLYDFPAHINFVPYENIETGKRFYKACGLVYSQERDGILYPDYGMVIHEVLSKTLFQKLASQKEEPDLSRESYH